MSGVDRKTMDFSRKLAKQGDGNGESPKIWSELKGGRNEFSYFASEVKSTDSVGLLILSISKFVHELCSSEIEFLQELRGGGRFPVVEQPFFLKKGKVKTVINLYAALPEDDVWILRICEKEDRKRAMARAQDWVKRFKIHEKPFLVDSDGNPIPLI